jgi:transcriptional regulator with XRE-family HTH domain
MGSHHYPYRPTPAKELAYNLGITYKQMVEACGVSHGMVDAVLNGYRAPSPHFRESLRDLFGFPPDQLLHDYQLVHPQEGGAVPPAPPDDPAWREADARRAMARRRTGKRS